MNKAVILAAGKGIRMLPVTNGMSKEMLLLKERPVIDYSIEEAIKAGCNEICIVLNKDKKDLIDHLKGIRTCKITLVYREPRGIMDAIKSVEEFANNNPFILILPDMINISEKNPSVLVRDTYLKFKGGVIALIEDPKKFGKGSFAIVNEKENGIYQIQGISNEDTEFRFFGRYVFDKKVFQYLRKLKAEENEQTLLNEYIKNNSLFGPLLSGKSYDTGIPEGYREAQNL